MFRFILTSVRKIRGVIQIVDHRSVVCVLQARGGYTAGDRAGDNAGAIRFLFAAKSASRLGAVL